MTIKDIAKECNCGIGTVSRVLNNHPSVSEETRKRVLNIVEKYGFILNRNAKELKMHDNKTIVVFVKGTSNVLLNSMLEIIQKRMEPLPFNASVINLDEDDNEALSANKVYYEQKPIGMIFLGGSPDRYKDDFLKIKIPCVFISNQAESLDNKNISSVSTDNLLASEFSTDYLINKGHTKIGVIGGNLESSEISKIRFQGFLNSINKAHLDFDFNKAYVTSKYSYSSGAKAAKKLISQYPDLTAIFTMSDTMAIGACRQLKDMNYSIPNQISIIGFDGLSVADFYCPRLTTIKQQEIILAEEGLNILLNSINEKKEAIHKIIPFKLIPGESVKNLSAN